MTINEAILILTQVSQGRNLTEKAREQEAERLGVEGLKRLKEYREWHRSTADGPLEGETEEAKPL